jgi:enoyl-CoA hydratase
MAVLMRLMDGDVAVPLVGAANASAFGGGLEVLLGCDVIVASSDAKFGLPEVKRGLFAPFGSVVAGSRMPRAVALELTLTGDPIDAARALTLGLVNQVVPRAQVLDAGMALAERIAGNAPLAVQATRDVVRLATADAAAAWERQGEWVPKVFGSHDAKEGASAFVERRAPIWTGT